MTLLHYTIKQDGWFEDVNDQISCSPSPNCDQGRDGNSVDLLVIHYISLPSGDFTGDHIVDLFLNKVDLSAHESFTDLEGLKVSAHFLIRRDGKVIQFVSTEDRAWHAGDSTFKERKKCNEFSIGIEMEGCEALPFEEPQYAVLAALTHELQVRYPTLNSVLGHEHIAPGRKFDPGPNFDWTKFKDALTTYRLQVVTNLPMDFPAMA